MRISSDMLNLKPPSEKVPPSPENIKKASERVLRAMDENGYQHTELSRLIVPEIAGALVGLRIADTSLPKQGIAIIGTMGTGKTLFLKLAAHFFGVEFLDVPSLSVSFSRSGADSFWNKISKPFQETQEIFILDDLGAEKDARNYGNAVPIAELIYDKYNRWQNFGELIWLSSNMTWPQLTERYGDRVTDRIKEMCKIIPVTSKSMR